ncbi:MAG: class I SAM-dependent methyltransferase [Eubacterium sp.]|nr:class I SAM-dependent methyltransferase [Eubacterium sp.]
MRLKNVDSGAEFEWGFTSEQYAEFRDIYPPELYARLRALGVASDGTAWLDLGTGTGVLPLNLYNKNADITATDITAEQIHFAKQLSKSKGYDINFFTAPAEHTGLPDNSFDCITAAQCFWYFDREAIKTEVKRLIKPGGKLIKIFMDWSLDDEIAAKSVELVKRYNPVWTSGESAFEDLYDDLFDGRVTESFESCLPFTRDTWHGRMCACRGTLASMNKEQFDAWSSAHLKMLSDYPESFSVLHKIYISYFSL